MAREELGIARFFMVIASFWPLFLLWAIRGSPLIDDWIFFTMCGLLIIVPNIFVLARILIAQYQKDIKVVTIENAQDHRDHILIYLITILLPVYSLSLDTWRSFYAVSVALFLTIIIFWLLDLHYMNLFFTIFGYKIYTINPEGTTNQKKARANFVLITQKSPLVNGELIDAYRISDTIFIDLSSG